MNLPNIVPSPNSFSPREGSFNVPSGKTLTEVAETLIDKKITNDEEYRLHILEDKVVIRAGSKKGAFYGMQSLKQIEHQFGTTVPCMSICDNPMYKHRGFMIDCARYFLPMEDLKKMIEACALLKFNVFHWHLTEDQGWRIEIDKYPLLNTISSRRMSSQYGRVEMDMRPHGGLYTKDDIREIVALCKELQIDVIPEIDMPGHTRALLAAYPELSCRKLALPVAVRAGIFTDGLCPGQEEVFEFVFNVLDEVIDLFPGDYIHLGGDEMPKYQWEKCPDCNARLRVEGLDNFEDLQAYFTNRVSAYLKEKGKKTIVWNDALKSDLVSKDVVAQRWISDDGRANRFANAGGKLIASDFYYYYTDYPYGMTPVRKTYNFDPKVEALTEEGSKNLMGIEIPIWGEFVRNIEEMSYMTFPRFAAAAETAWTRPENKNTEGFFNRFEAIAPMIQKLGIEPADRQDWNPSKEKKDKEMRYMLKQRYDWRIALAKFGKDDYQ